MTTPRKFLAAIFAVSVLTVSAFAADVSGTWKWTSVSKHGGPAEVTGVFLFKDGALTGTVTGRQGPAGIDNGTFKDGAIAFTVSRSAGGTAMVVFKYAGKLEGDTITGTLERPGPTPEAPPTKTDWKATRVK